MSPDVRDSGITDHTNLDAGVGPEAGVVIKGDNGERTPIDGSTAASMGLTQDETTTDDEG